MTDDAPLVAAGRGSTTQRLKGDTMKISFTIGADFREMQGKGASRRLRHSGKVPAILYGGHKEPRALMLDQQNLLTMIEDEKFYSSIVQLKITESGQTQEAIVKDIQMHPARHSVVHVDLQRVVPNEKIRIRLPIHFKGEAVSPGVKLQGGIVSHRLSDVEVSCLPSDLPEFLEMDLSQMNLNETKFLADVPVPKGVTFTELSGGRNPPVVSVHAPRAEEPEPTAEAAAATPAEGAAPAAGAAGAAPAAGAAAPAAGAEGAKKDDKAAAAPAKKEGGKK
jgi:large subunit ribosomal protein L25